MATGMSSGVELPPRCRAWVTTAGRPTRRCGRVRPQKTTARWRGPVTPEPNPFGGAEPKQGYRIGRRSQTLTDSVTVPGPAAVFRGRAARRLAAGPGRQGGCGQRVEGRAAEADPGVDRPGAAYHPARRSRPMLALVADPSASPALTLADVAEPSAGPGQLVVRMEAASINRGEIRTAAGQPPGKIIGWDVVGTVVALGDGVAGFQVGQRVLGLAPTGGAFAELVALADEWTIPLPSSADSVLAATLPVAGLTAVNVLRLPRVHAGDRVLVTGAAGGVGQLAVQLALDAKATVTGQVSSERRAATVRELGAEALIHPGDGSPVDGEFDVVLDSIGGPMFAPLLRTAALRGRVVVFGNSADAESTFRVEDFYTKAVTIYGFRVFQSVPPEQGVKDLAALADQVAAGQLRVSVQATAPLTEALPLVRDLYDRKVMGKVVITGP